VTPISIYLTNQGREGLPEQVAFAALRSAAISTIQLPGTKKRLAWATVANGRTVVEIPEALRKTPPCQHAFALTFALGQ
jgi:hypothetical protein